MIATIREALGFRREAALGIAITLACFVTCNADAPTQQVTEEPKSQASARATPTGSVSGKVVYVADPQHPWRLGRYYIRSKRTGELAEAVVALSQRRLAAPQSDRKSATVTMDQKNFQFVPETVAIRVGDTVRFLNSDEHVHNVRTSHPKQSFNINMPAGAAQEVGFRFASGIRQPFTVDCVFHSAMRAWVYVFDHPWFAVTGKDGRFELKDVVPGKYRIDVAHPAGKLRASVMIEVDAGKETQRVIRLRPVPAD